MIQALVESDAKKVARYMAAGRRPQAVGLVDADIDRYLKIFSAEYIKSRSLKSFACRRPQAAALAIFLIPLALFLHLIPPAKISHDLSVIISKEKT